MVFIFAILFGILCLVLRLIYKRINWSQIMSSNGNKQRIENSSDCPDTIDLRLKNAASLDGGSARSDKHYYG